MKRRKFLILGSIFGTTPYLKAKSADTVERSLRQIIPTLTAVTSHLFPVESPLSSEGLERFLFETMHHSSFDKDTRAFIIEGAEALEKREKNRFSSLNPSQKEEALRAYEETSYGGNWLSTLMTLSLEGLLSDPIYGANKNEKGWKAIESYGGFPRPKTKYRNVK